MDISLNIKKITSILNNYLRPFDLTAELSYDFGYYFESNTVTYSLLDIKEASDSFLLDAESRFPQIRAPFFIWALHHELGHHETWDELTEEEIAESEDIKKRCYEENNRLLYYTAPDEYAATNWAGKYIMEHEAEIASLWDAIVSIIKKMEGEDNE